MRGKRSKQYRKLMHQYGLTFGFREPYQVLLDADIIRDSDRFKIDLVKGLERTLLGRVKPMITQCAIRHLYADQTRKNLIEQAKTFERRRCNHHTLDEPLSTIDCLKSVVDPKHSKTNKHRYVIASQDAGVRAHMRRIPGVPLIYISRNVMIIEPMAGATEEVRDREEKQKFRAGLVSRQNRSVLGKRAREDEDAKIDSKSEVQPGQADEGAAAKRPRKRGPKQPNPMSVKKPKARGLSTKLPQNSSTHPGQEGAGTNITDPSLVKKKRRRKPSSRADTEALNGIAE